MSDQTIGTDAVAIVATMDTKQAEVDYVAKIIGMLGRQVVLVDVGTTNEARSDDPAKLLAEIGSRARGSLTEMQRAGRITAVIGIAGGKGSAVFGEAISELPFGFPKLLVSSARPALLADLGSKSDIMIYTTLVDLFGVNGFTARLLDNAAHAVASMRFVPRRKAGRKIVAISAFGVTTPAANRCVQLLADSDVESIVFPANGSGGRKMESLVDAGEFDAVLDLTTTELADELAGGTASAGPDRLAAAGRVGIPHLVAPGAVDMVNFGAPATVPQKYSGRKFYSHTPYTTLMRTTSEETREIGRRTGSMLAQSRGAVQVLWPAEGVSDYDRKGAVFFDSPANIAWLEGLRRTLPPSISLREMPCHINDPAFADAAVGWILQNILTEVPK